MTSLTSSFDVDKITLQCFVNRNSYQKYLAKKDPESFESTQKTFQKWRTHHDELLELFSEYIYDPEAFTSTTKKEVFHKFVTDCMSTIESRKLKQNEDSSSDNDNDNDSKNKTIYNNDDYDEDETLFSQCDDSLRVEPKNPIEFWKMQKVFKSQQQK